jgi:hypothetical protein
MLLRMWLLDQCFQRWPPNRVQLTVKREPVPSSGSFLRQHGDMAGFLRSGGSENVRLAGADKRQKAFSPREKNPRSSQNSREFRTFQQK